MDCIFYADLVVICRACHGEKIETGSMMLCNVSNV